MITKLNGIEMVKLLRVHIVQYLTPMAKLHNKKKPNIDIRIKRTTNETTKNNASQPKNICKTRKSCIFRVKWRQTKPFRFHSIRLLLAFQVLYRMRCVACVFFLSRCLSRLFQNDSVPVYTYGFRAWMSFSISLHALCFSPHFRAPLLSIGVFCMLFLSNFRRAQGRNTNQIEWNEFVDTINNNANHITSRRRKITKQKD